MTIEVKKGGKTYANAETAEPPYTKADMLAMLDAGYTVYRNGKRVSKASLKAKNDP